MDSSGYSRLTLARLRVLLLLVPLAVALTGCGGSAAPAASGKSAKDGKADAGREVKTVTAVEDQLVRRVGVTGTLAAEEQVTLSLKVTGRLDSLLVDLGSPVHPGQVVARLTPNDFVTRVSQASAACNRHARGSAFQSTVRSGRWIPNAPRSPAGQSRSRGSATDS